MIVSDNFTPWFGRVESVDDPDKSGRYQVRVYGYNSTSFGVLPTDNLKWFSSGVSNSAGAFGLGHSPTGYKVGSFVFGFYIDKDKQEGIILCAFNGTPFGISDVSAIAKGLPTPPVFYLDVLTRNLALNIPDARGEIWNEPITRYMAQYPHNQVFQTESGHVVEYDDTPGAERIMVFHKSGTFEEIHPDGKRVVRNIGDSFEVDLSSKYVYVKGNLNAVVSGDYRIAVNGEYYVKAANVIFDTPNVDIYGESKANDHISSNISGAYHIHSGVMSGLGVSATPVGASTMFAPSPANSYYLETEDTGYTPVVIQFGLQNGFLTPDDVIEIETSVPVVEEKDETPIVETRAEVVECSAAIVDGRVDYNALLSTNIKLRELSIAAVVSNYTIIDQGGRSRDEIICNLKNLAENVIEPLRAQYPKAMITSAFRHGSGKSQHERGEAIDIQVPNMSKAEYYEMAQWVKANLPYDQLLLEYKTTGTKLPWIHISLTRSKKQRYQVMTFMNHRKAADGLAKLQ